jgi:hypothetical protein
VQVVQLSSEDFDDWPADATPDLYSVIPETFVRVPLPKLEFTSVDTYPSNYPPRIVDDAEATRLKSGFDLVRVERLYSSSNNKASMVVEVTFPAPRVTIACELLIRPEKAGWQESIKVVAGRGGVSTSSRSGVEDEPRIERDTYRDATDELRHLLRIELPMMAGSLRWIDSGTIVHIELVASESVARQSTTVSEYLDLKIQRSRVLTEPVPGNP